jgi:hypothetical protein
MAKMPIQSGRRSRDRSSDKPNVVSPAARQIGSNDARQPECEWRAQLVVSERRH